MDKPPKVPLTRAIIAVKGARRTFLLANLLMIPTSLRSTLRALPNPPLIPKNMPPTIATSLIIFSPRFLRLSCPFSDSSDADFSIRSLHQEIFTLITISDCGYIFEEGKAKLPILRRMIEIPQGTTPDIFLQDLGL